MSEPAPPAGILLSDDLMFSSRITGTARAQGLAVNVARSGEQLIQAVRKLPPRCVLLDLAIAGSDLIERLKRECVPPPLLVAYGSHVDAETLRAAREAGCDVVLPRSKFALELPQALPRWLAGPSAPTPEETP
jgi:CheY-like chemotaxis protein